MHFQDPGVTHLGFFVFIQNFSTTWTDFDRDEQVYRCRTFFPERHTMRRERPEAKIQEQLVEFLLHRDWVVNATHGNAFQKGFPDLFAAHKRHGQRWIDCKVEGRYSFTKAQKQIWPKWEAVGVGVWILTGANDEQYSRLFKPPNMRDYWRESWGQLPDIDALLRDLNETPD